MSLSKRPSDSSPFLWALHSPPLRQPVLPTLPSSSRGAVVADHYPSSKFNGWNLKMMVSKRDLPFLLVPFSAFLLNFGRVWKPNDQIEILQYVLRPLFRPFKYMLLPVHTPRNGHLDKLVSSGFLPYINILSYIGKMSDTVDGWNPAPPGMYETLKIMGNVPYQLVQDFFHQQYQIKSQRSPSDFYEISGCKVSWINIICGHGLLSFQFYGLWYGPWRASDVVWMCIYLQNNLVLWKTADRRPVLTLKKNWIWTCGWFWTNGPSSSKMAFGMLGYHTDIYI